MLERIDKPIAEFSPLLAADLEASQVGRFTTFRNVLYDDLDTGDLYLVTETRGIPNAHLFEEPAAIEFAAQHADWQAVTVELLYSASEYDAETLVWENNETPVTDIDNPDDIEFLLDYATIEEPPRLPALVEAEIERVEADRFFRHLFGIDCGVDGWDDDGWDDDEPF